MIKKLHNPAVLSSHNLLHNDLTCSYCRMRLDFASICKDNPHRAKRCLKCVKERKMEAYCWNKKVNRKGSEMSVTIENDNEELWSRDPRAEPISKSCQKTY